MKFYEFFKMLANKVGIKFHEQKDKTFLVTVPEREDPVARVSPDVVKQLKKEKVVTKTTEAYVSPRSRYEVNPTKAKKLEESYNHHYHTHTEEESGDAAGSIISTGLGMAAGFALAELLNNESEHIAPSHESFTPTHHTPEEPVDSVTRFDYEGFSPSATEPERDSIFGSATESSSSDSGWGSSSSDSSDWGSSSSSDSSSSFDSSSSSDSSW